MRSIADLLALASILAADPWPGVRFRKDCRFGGAPWAATRDKKRWKRMRRCR